MYNLICFDTQKDIKKETRSEMEMKKHRHCEKERQSPRERERKLDVQWERQTCQVKDMAGKRHTVD